MLPSKVQQLVQLLSRLPGVGEKTAQRYALFLAATEMDTARALGDALHGMAEGVGHCARCGNLADVVDPETPPCCTICSDNKRDAARLCVVARIQDLLSIERSHAFRGHYFVLGRLLSPLEGVGAEELPVDALKLRIEAAEPPVTEILIATPPSVDGEATALLLAQELAPTGVRISRLATGVPHGGDLEFADPVTIGRAIAGRRGMDS
ncbi:MAG: recombination protein RecR [Deltaproteobacteria bacterium]|nr:recombination protein RecR [Deltaproteobacteria bacterium]